MNYTIVYEPDYPRILTAVLIDCRATIPQLANKVGFDMKAYIDNQIALIGSDSIFYKIETDLGVIAGCFSVDVNTGNKTASVNINLLRPAFQKFTEIQSKINNFMSNKLWERDYLFTK